MPTGDPSTVAPRTLPRGHRFAAPLAAAAALVAVMGSGVLVVRTAQGSDVAHVGQQVSEVTRSPEPPYTLRTGPLSVQLAARPTQEVTREQVAGGTAVNTTWTVSTPQREQMVATYVLPRGTEFRLDTPSMLKESAQGADLTLGPVETGQFGRHPWAEAQVTAPDGTAVVWRVMRIGRIRVDLMAPVEDHIQMVDSLRVR